MGDAPERQRERSTALRAIGLAMQRKRDYVAAERFFRRGIEVSDAYGTSLNLLSLGHMYLEQGQAEAALGAFQRCLDELVGPGVQKRSRCQALIGAGEAELARDRPDRALRALRSALDTAVELGSSVDVYRAHHGLARALRETGDAEAALDHYEAYHRHREQVMREVSDVRTEVLVLQYDVERLRKDREIDRLTNVELARAYRELRELHRQLERQAAELERLSNLDGLTGLHNRRALDARLETELARSRRSGVPLSLLMLDIDDFKEVNDRFSHTVGDEVLASGAPHLFAGPRRRSVRALRRRGVRGGDARHRHRGRGRGGGEAARGRRVGELGRLAPQHPAHRQPGSGEPATAGGRIHPAGPGRRHALPRQAHGQELRPRHVGDGATRPPLGRAPPQRRSETPGRRPGCSAGCCPAPQVRVPPSHESSPCR